MSQTKVQKRKQKKKKDKQRANTKRRNIEHNLAPLRYRWDVFYDGRWAIGFKEYRKWDQVQAKLNETERLRDEGVEIAAGRIVDLVLGKIIKEVAPSPAKPQGKGALPDKLADEPDSAKGILGR